MNVVDKICQEFGDEGVETSFDCAGRTFHVFAYSSPGRYGPRVRWNLYTVDEGGKLRTGLCFGMAKGVREAMEEVIRAAENHSRHEGNSRTLTFRPPAFD